MWYILSIWCIHLTREIQFSSVTDKTEACPVHLFWTTVIPRKWAASSISAILCIPFKGKRKWTVFLIGLLQ